MMIRGSDVLSVSSKDTITLASCVENRMLELFQSHPKYTGTPLEIPHDILRDIKLWREMRKRHKRNDFRNTHSELKATRIVAQFTIDVHMRIRGQEPVKVVWGM